MLTENAGETIRVLLIEDNPGDARLVRERLLSASRARFEVESVDRLASAIERLRRAGIDVVLLDLSLPDSQGMETITRLHAEAPEIPIIALSGLDDQGVIQDAVKQGAEDYLVKGAFSTDILVRTILYAIDRQRLREDLARARDLALESARVRSEFLANMSHEIRTPLNGVVGMTRLLIDTLVSADQREMLEIACMSANALLKIVNDILDFSKVSAGKVVLEEADFDLGTAVENVVQIFSEQAHGKGVVLDSFIDADVPMRLRGDSGRLCQVLVNLIGNAVKFTAVGEATVRVERVGGGTDHSVLRFQVRDTGIGIPFDGQRNIFQAFTQGDGATTRRFGGTGLGLTISAQLVELMEGNIGVESESGHGSTFWFTARFAHQPAAALHASDADHPELERVRVLVVDGNANSARVMCDHVRAWRMRPEIATNMALALAALKPALTAGDPFQIAIIDLQMPDQAGLDLARAIKDIPELVAIRVLGLYALGGRPQQTLTRAAGIRALLSKPVRQSQLFNTLNALMAMPVELLPELPRRGRLVREIKSVIPAEIRQRTRILLVEDNLVNQQVEMRMIDRIGYHAEPADNGRVALEQLAHTDFDIILMDCQMPEVDGYSATREIRRREGSARHTPIIGVTAHALPGDREECLRAGMDDYIAKPVMPEDLAAIIDKWVAIVKLPPAAKMEDADAQGSRQVTQAQAAAVLDENVLAELREYQNPGEPDFLTELIGVFDEDITNRLAQIGAGLEAGDANRVRQAAHALKGASGELGAQRMREICERLELSAAGGSITSAPGMVRELEDEAVHVRAALATHRVEVPMPGQAPGV
jgi:two-component system, sensor histidine kinase and response regulator